MSSTRRPAAMAIATTWTDLDGAIPYDMAARILPVARSAISLQNPIVRPSMIVRAVSSKRTMTTTTS